MIIDTNSQVEMSEFEERLYTLMSEKLSKGGYDSSDIALVRITDAFPQDKVLPAICNVPFLTRINDLSSEVVKDMLFEKERQAKGEDVVSYERGLELIEESKTYSPLSTQYRSSIHFTLNGPVSDHEYGKFDGEFAVIEPFKYHEDDMNILSVRGDDTYFKDGITLSDEAIVLVPEKYKDSIDNPSNNIIFYRGDLKKAVDMCLVKMGIVPEIVRDSYIEESKTSTLLNGFIEEKGYERERHCYHKNYDADDKKNPALWKYYNNMFFSYLLNIVYQGNINQSELQLLNSWHELDMFDERPRNLLRTIIEKIGLDEYKKIVEQFNQNLLDKVRQGEYPTNNDILGITPLNLDEINQNIR